jgi:ribosome-binding factor A
MSRSSQKKGPSQRQLRAGELVRHALVEIFQREDLRDPALHGLSITVTEVRMTPDLKQATVFCAPLGASIDTERHPEIIKALGHAAPHLRHLLGRKVDMKFTPTLVFRSDESFAEARRIDELLASPGVARDLDRE